MTHSMSDVSCLPPCPLICRRSISILMLTPWLRGCVECLRTKLGLRGTTSQSPYLCASWQRVARSFLTWCRWLITLRLWRNLVLNSSLT
jgi:hypothetical protein